MLPDALVRAHADLVYRVALRTTGTADDAADAAQEALVKLWRHGPDVPEEKQRAFAARIARNAALDLLRRRAVRPQPFLQPDTPVDPACASPLPDADAETADLRRDLARAVDALGEPFRSLVVLRDIEGLAYAEIADALDLPLTSVKVYLHRARARLRVSLSPTLSDHAA